MRTRAVGLITEDAALYADLAAGLRERRIPTISLLPGDRIPDRVAVVLTSPSEAPGIPHPRVLAVSSVAHPATLWAAVTQALLAPDRSHDSELIVGLDPGPRPGYAIFADGRLLAEGTLAAPESVARFAGELAERFPRRGIRFRVGLGDPPARNRLVAALQREEYGCELVDEHSTSPRLPRTQRDAVAARAIARTPGRAGGRLPPVRTTLGALRRIQHLSREGSGGRFTISRAEAQQVLSGELSLAEAVAAGDARFDRARSAGTKADIGERVRRTWPPPNPS